MRLPDPFFSLGLNRRQRARLCKLFAFLTFALVFVVFYGTNGVIEDGSQLSQNKIKVEGDEERHSRSKYVKLLAPRGSTDNNDESKSGPETAGPQLLPLYRCLTGPLSTHYYFSSDTQDVFKILPPESVYEGVTGFLTANASKTSPDQFVRFYAGRPLYDSILTANRSEIEQLNRAASKRGLYKFDAVLGYCSFERRISKDQCTLYRMTLTNHSRVDHLYTVDQMDVKLLMAEGWTYEGVACHIFCSN